MDEAIKSHVNRLSVSKRHDLIRYIKKTINASFKGWYEVMTTYIKRRGEPETMRVHRTVKLSTGTVQHVLSYKKQDILMYNFTYDKTLGAFRVVIHDCTGHPERETLTYDMAKAWCRKHDVDVLADVLDMYMYSHPERQ